MLKRLGTPCPPALLAPAEFPLGDHLAAAMDDSVSSIGLIAGPQSRRRHRGFREPDGQASALAQGDVIGGTIRHSVPLLRDVMTAILVRFEWHDDVRSQKRARLLYRPLRAANHRSVQQGHHGHYGTRTFG